MTGGRRLVSDAYATLGDEVTPVYLTVCSTDDEVGIMVLSADEELEIHMSSEMAMLLRSKLATAVLNQKCANLDELARPEVG